MESLVVHNLIHRSEWTFMCVTEAHPFRLSGCFLNVIPPFVEFADQCFIQISS